MRILFLVTIILVVPQLSRGQAINPFMQPDPGSPLFSPVTNIRAQDGTVRPRGDTRLNAVPVRDSRAIVEMDYEPASDVSEYDQASHYRNWLSSDTVGTFILDSNGTPIRNIRDRIGDQPREFLGIEDEISRESTIMRRPREDEFAEQDEAE